MFRENPMNSMNEEKNNFQDTPPTEAPAPAKREFNSTSDAFKAGREDGAAKAREKSPEFLSGMANALHDLAYGVAYGTVFAGAFANELIPENIRNGLFKGAEAGKKDGKSACQKTTETFSAEDSAPDGSTFS